MAILHNYATEIHKIDNSIKLKVWNNLNSENTLYEHIILRVSFKKHIFFNELDVNLTLKLEF